MHPDPTLGRFVGEDPIGFAGSDVNVSRYVRNASPSVRDPSGLQDPYLQWFFQTYVGNPIKRYVGMPISANVATPISNAASQYVQHPIQQHIAPVLQGFAGGAQMGAVIVGNTASGGRNPVLAARASQIAQANPGAIWVASGRLAGGTAIAIASVGGSGFAFRRMHIGIGTWPNTRIPHVAWRIGSQYRHGLKQTPNAHLVTVTSKLAAKWWEKHMLKSVPLPVLSTRLALRTGGKYPNCFTAALCAWSRGNFHIPMAAAAKYFASKIDLKLNGE